MDSSSNLSRKRMPWVPPTDLPRPHKQDESYSPKKHLSTIDSDLPFEYYNNYPKTTSKTSNIVSSVCQDEYNFDIEEPLQYLDTESEANQKSDHLTAIEEVETKGEDLQPRESLLFSSKSQEEIAKVQEGDQSSISISKIGDFITEQVKDFIQESNAIESDIKRLGNALKQANTSQQSMYNPNSEMLSVSNDNMRNFSAFNRPCSVQNSFMHRALSSKSIPKDDSQILPTRNQQSRNRPLNQSLKKVIEKNQICSSSAIHPLKKVALTAFSDPSLSARSGRYLIDDEATEEKPSFLNQELQTMTKQKIVSQAPTLNARELDHSPTLEPMSLGSARRVETEYDQPNEDESDDVIQQVRKEYLEESNAGGIDLYDQLLNELDEVVANITDLARVEGIYIESPETQSPVNDLNEIIKQLINECKLRMDKVTGLELQNNKMKEIMMGLNQTLTDVNRQAMHHKKKYKRLKMETRMTHFQYGAYTPDPLTGGASTVSTENRTVRDDTYRTSRSHFDPKKEKQKGPESTLIEATRTIRDLEQKLKDSEECEKSIRSKFTQQMVDMTNKDKQILKLQSQNQSLQQRLDLNKATSLLRPTSPKVRNQRAQKLERELKQLDSQLSATKNLLEKTNKELEFNHKQNSSLKEQRNNYRQQVEEQKAVLRKIAQFFGNQHLDQKELLSQIQDSQTRLNEHELFFRKLMTIVVPKEQDANKKLKSVQNEILEKVRDQQFSLRQTTGNNNDYWITQKRGESPFQTVNSTHSANVTPIRSMSKGVPSPFRYQDFKQRSRCVDSEYERTKEFRDFKFSDYSYSRASPFKTNFKYY